MANYAFIFGIISILAGECLGQTMIHGKVSDATTAQPLPYANVFINNTTLGTATNDSGEYSLEIAAGEYDFVFSFIGYQPQKIRASVGSRQIIKLDVILLPLTRELQILTIYGNEDKKWKRLMQRFEKSFLGPTPSADRCIIRNATSIDLDTKKIGGKHVLMAKSSQPVEVDNFDLGYRIFYDLLEFFDSDKLSRFSGNAYFVELKAKDSIQSNEWIQNRRNTYLGSSRHLFKSVLEGRLKEEGFTVFSKNSGSEIQDVAVTSLPIETDSTSSKFKIRTGGRIIVYYQSHVTNTTLMGRIDAPNGYVETDQHGVVLDPLSFVLSGYLSKTGLANLLPNDYHLPSEDLSKSTIIPKLALAAAPEYSGPIHIDSLVAVANRYSENNPTEKVYLHLDRSVYFKGEDCWYKAYVVNENLDASNISSVLYVDWIDPLGNIISHKRLKIQDGGAVGDYTIDTALQDGIYSVRAYTNWMRNSGTELFFSRQIQVIDPMTPNNATDSPNGSLKIDLQFFPEGGTLIAGVKGLVAYKAIDVNGRGIEVKGRVVDEQNKLITTFKSSKMGMGSFPFVGDLKKSFRAILENGEAFNLPIPSPAGITLAASNMNADAVLLQIQIHRPDESVMYLIGQSRGSICYAETISMNSDIKEIAISRKQLPEGIVQFTLLNSRGIPQCERMLFIKKAETMIVNVTGTNDQYLPRDSTMLSVQVADHNKNPVQTSLSISITEADFTKTTRTSENIYTRFLLQSDLKGNVENPAWYFESDTPERLYALDLVMLTHGWSKYDWNKLLKSKDESSFLPENGITLTGQVLANKKPIANTPFIFMIPDSAQSAFGIYETDSLGFFNIKDLDFSDSTMAEWRVMKKKGPYANRKIQLTENENLPRVMPLHTGIHFVTAGGRQSYHKILKTFNNTGVWNFGAAKMLDEVEVKAKRINAISIGMNRQIIVPTAEDLLGVTGQFANRYAPGISAARLVRISEDQEIWTLPSGGRIIVSIDGYVRSPYDFQLNPFLLLNTVAVDEIEYLAVSGDPHNGYFIDLRTKDPSKLDPPGTIKQLVKGYDVAREFYHPKYGPTDVSSIGPDNRITLYWNSSLSTDENGIATINFYNNDITETFQIVVEGIANGKPISLVRTFGARNKE